MVALTTSPVSTLPAKVTEPTWATLVTPWVVDAAEVKADHTLPKSYTAFYHLLCDIGETYGEEAVIRASGSIKTLFELPTFIDME